MTMVVAVIDSGVQPGHPHIDAARLLPGLAIARDGTLSDGGDATCDRLGHGTAVTALIQHLAPDVRVLPIRVFHDALAARATVLALAIGAAAARGAGVINCSLGTANPAHAGVMQRAIDQAAPGRVVAPIATPDGAPCWPGHCSGALGVGLDWDQPPGTARFSAGLWLAAGFARPIPGVPLRQNLHGVSFATATLSALLAAGVVDGFVA